MITTSKAVRFEILFHGISIALVLVGFSTRLSIAQGVTFGNINPYFSYEYGDGGIPSNIPNTTGQQTSTDGQAVKLYGDCGPISGASFGSGFVLDWSGTYQGEINNGDELIADLDYSASATGGALEWSFYADLSPNAGGGGARISTSLAPMPPSGQVSGIELISPPATQDSIPTVPFKDTYI